MISYLVLAFASFAYSQFPVPAGDGTFGSGKYPSTYSQDPGLKGHTIYSPKSPPPEKLPVILWSNGMCMDQGLGFRNFLNEIASHGYIIVANGLPEGTGQSSDQKLLNALNYVDKVAGTGSGPFANADKTRIGAAGQSCGGWQAYKVSVDPRIQLTGIFDSGGNSNAYISKLHAPVGYFLGGSSDMAFKPGTQDYGALPASVPALYVNNPKGGHMQDFFAKQGGLVAIAGRSFFDWIFKNSTAGSEMFTSKISTIGKAGWEVKSKGFK